MKKGIFREIQLAPKYFFSPGFYLNYWANQILPNFNPKTITTSVKFKQHREVWIGAHLAALKTHLSDIQFFVGIPESDPPDVLVGAFEKIKVSSGRVGHNLNWFPVEITRCDVGFGEDLLKQILAKNKPAWKDMVLVVYLQGAEELPDMQEISAVLNNQGTLYLHEIIVMVELQGAPNSLPPGSFGFVQLYPQYDSVVLKRNDKDAYFLTPNIMTATGRGIQSKYEHIETIRLMPPIL